MTRHYRKHYLPKCGHRAYARQYRSQLYRDARKRLGNKCARCNYADSDLLDIDHIIPRALTNFPDKKSMCFHILSLSNPADHYQLLCGTCHKRKTAEDQKWLRNNHHQPSFKIRPCLEPQLLLPLESPAVAPQSFVYQFKMAMLAFGGMRDSGLRERPRAHIEAER
jgi:5-methylcytosine-specific restriction endonuclease McrA